jgi:co-chaperonin GroES (HSP10)
MKGVLDNYIIELDCLYETGLIVGNSSSQFFEKTISLDEKDILYNPNKYKKTYATIIATPQRLTERCEKEGGATVFEVGDTVHFYWSALNKDREIEKKKLWGEVDKNGNIKMSFTYLLPAWRAICVTRGEDILMNKNFILLEPIFQSEDEIKTSSGLFIQSEVKKHLNCGTIVYSNNYRGCDVYFLPNSNSEVTINGKVYYAMKESDVFAIKHTDEFVVVEDYILISPEPEKDKTEGGVFIPESHRKFLPKGEVAFIGDEVLNVNVGDYVSFEDFLGIFESPIGDFIIVKESGIVYKHSK